MFYLISCPNRCALFWVYLYTLHNIVTFDFLFPAAVINKSVWCRGLQIMVVSCPSLMTIHHDEDNIDTMYYV